MIQHETYDSTSWCQTTALMLSFPGDSVVQNPPVNARAAGDMGSPLGWEDPLKQEMSTHSSMPAWETPWMGEFGRLQSMGSQRVRHDQATEHTTKSMYIIILYWHFIPSRKPFLPSLLFQPSSPLLWLSLLMKINCSQ